MNNCTQLRINISHLPDAIRKIVPELIGTTTNQCDASAGDTGSSHLQMPRTVYKAVWAESSGGRLASHVTADLNVPDAVAGHQFEQGTSMYAVGRAGLELARIELAQAGLPKEALDRLTTAHVSFQTAVMAYLFRFPTSTITSSVSRDITHYARLLDLNIECPSANTVVYRGDMQPDVNLTGGDASELLEEFALTVMSWPTQNLVRLDVSMTGNYLRSRGWTTLDSWKHAYAENRYQLIFNETVRKLFRLDEKQHCLNEPGPAVYAHVSILEEDMLRGYIAGKDPVTLHRFGLLMSEVKRKKALNDIRKSILIKSGIDIKIPWRDFQQLGCPVLDRHLKYPGDFQPDAERISSHFCKENWPQLLDRLFQAYKQATSGAIS